MSKKSLLGKTWLYPEKTDLDFVSYFLQTRRVENHEEFFDKKFPDGLFNENLLKDLDKGVERVCKAIEKKERIVVFGDYDCDGIPGTAICVSVLKSLGAQVSYRIPDREKDGYGLKNYFLDELKEKGVKLVITIDNGIASLNEAIYAKELGIDLIITDHHEVQDGKIPEALAVINPQREDCNYPFKELCGAAVGWKLMIGIAKKMKGDEWANSHVRDKFIELVALSTVTDIMPLISENRVIVSEGLKKIKETENEGLLALFDEMGAELGEEVTSDFFGFQLGPRINATGRMSHGHFGVQLLLGESKHAPYIESLNKERKELVGGILEGVEKEILESGKDGLVILKNKNWRSGIIGLIAGKIQERFNLPSIVCQEKGDKIVASCRAPIGFNIFEFLSNFKDFFTHFGGHAQACGFSIPTKKFKEFKIGAEKLATEILEKSSLENTLKIDFELTKKEFNLKFLTELRKLEPFGKGNESPIFLVKNIKTNLFTVGKERDHLSLKIFGCSAIGFNFGKQIEKLKKAEFLNLALVLSIKKWNGERRLNAQVVDILLSQ